MTLKFLTQLRNSPHRRWFLSLASTVLMVTGMGVMDGHFSQQSLAKPSAAEAAKYRWRVFNSPDRTFSVLMPGQPKVTSQTQKTFMGEIDVKLYIAQPPRQEVAYIVASNDFPDSYGKMANPQQVLQNAQAMALKTTQSKLIRQRQIQSNNGHPGREIEYVNPGGKITKNRMYFAEGRLYQVMVITTPRQKRYLQKSIPGYLNSFKIVLKR